MTIKSAAAGLLISVALATGAQAATFSGTVTGAWTNPVGAIGFNIDNDDAGTEAKVDWGNARFSTSFNNLWSFDGVGSDGGAGWSTATNDLFLLGDFVYRNGDVGDHDFAGADLTISLDFTTPLLQTVLFDYSFIVDNTPNSTGNPVTDGDFAVLTGSLTNQTFVFEGVDYTLELFGFSQDGGDTVVDEFRSPEGFTATAQLFGRIIQAPDVTPVPLPASAWLLLAGGGALISMRRRRG